MDNDLIDLARTYFRPYKKSVLFILLLLIVEVVSQIVLIDMIKPIVSYSLKSTDMGLLIRCCGYMIVSIIVYSVASVLVVRSSVKVASKTVSKLREDLFSKVVSLKGPEDSGIGASGLMIRLVSDTDYLQRFMIEFLSVALFVPILIIGVFVRFWMTEKILCLALIISLIVTTIVVRLLSKDEYEVRRKIQSLVDGTVRVFRGLVCGSRTARAYGRVETLYGDFSVKNKEYGSFATGTSIRMSWLYSIATLSIGFSILITLAVFAVIGDTQSISYYNAVTSFQFIILFVSCVSLIPFLIETVPSVKVSIKRIADVMNSDSERTGADVPVEDNDIMISCSNGLTVPCGSEVAIIGRVNGGKSELIRSLLLVDEPEKDTVFFKGKDITELDPHLLRERIAYAGPLAPAFRGTLRENIDMWRGLSDYRLEKAVSDVMLDLSLDYQIMKFGSNTSQGQMQKISIARALVSDADVYIFDDCFTEMDPSTENTILSNIRTSLKGKTIIISSPGYLTCRYADTIAVMEGGRIIGSGTHEEMMSSCEIYRKIHDLGQGYDE